MSAVNDIIRDAKREERDDIISALLRAAARIDLEYDVLKDLLEAAGVIDPDADEA